jgi:hypothetical protein
MKTLIGKIKKIVPTEEINHFIINKYITCRTSKSGL